ncbi:MAG: hypothetical protein NC114_06720 [Ruminococcus flavefaciens]|nr:hypothetical protein [Ruminococcus flavefaciens]
MYEKVKDKYIPKTDSENFATGVFCSVWNDGKYVIKSQCTINTATREIVCIDMEKRTIVTDDPDVTLENIDDIVQVLDGEYVIIDTSPDVRYVACSKHELVAGDVTTFWHN